MQLCGSYHPYWGESLQSDSYMGSPTHLLGDVRKPNKSVSSPKQDGYPESAVLEQVFIEHGVT